MQCVYFVWLEFTHSVLVFFRIDCKPGLYWLNSLECVGTFIRGWVNWGFFPLPEPDLFLDPLGTIMTSHSFNFKVPNFTIDLVKSSKFRIIRVNDEFWYTYRDIFYRVIKQVLCCIQINASIEVSCIFDNNTDFWIDATWNKPPNSLFLYFILIR